MGRHELFPRKTVYDILGFVCKTLFLGMREAICATPLYILAGFDPSQMDPVSYSIYLIIPLIIKPTRRNTPHWMKFKFCT